MDIKQIRIGNYINYNYLGTSIVSIIESGEDIAQADSNEYTPIELTEEWLLKFGYKKVNTLYDTTEVFEKDFSFTVYFRNGILSFSFKTIEIKYVHQLQNAVFYLEGKELTIKS